MSHTPMIVAAKKSRESLQQLKVNSMSVITLTEFLQKSVILPITHLGLVNNEVMRLFLEELQLIDHLRSLRHYFFLMDGEFGSIMKSYQILKKAVKKQGKAILKSPQYRHIQLMRHRFYHFVHTLQNHITANALQASCKTFKDDLLQAKSIEDI
ncbi:uncharacterized protein [Eurosta solidaginis]|uniref:uncharacterized protein n=1 Tax=Eurosta solidaginis TaxID=178769 RepID=UPI00353085E5